MKQEERLRARGWCPFVTWRFRESMPASVLMLADAAKFENSIGGHEKCTEQICVRNNIDTKTYEPSHECVDSDCRFVKSDLQDVMHIQPMEFGEERHLAERGTWRAYLEVYALGLKRRDIGQGRGGGSLWICELTESLKSCAKKGPSVASHHDESLN